MKLVSNRFGLAYATAQKMKFSIKDFFGKCDQTFIYFLFNSLYPMIQFKTESFFPNFSLNVNNKLNP